MSTHPFGVEAFRGKLHVSGEVDLAVSATLLDAILSAGLTGHNSDLVVDLSQVTFLDSSGIRTLVEAATRLANDGIGLRVTNPSPFVTKVFELSGVGAYLGLPQLADAD
jgi:anti-anti-sigma factor